MRHLASIKQLLEQIKPELRQRFHVQSIGIFGSVVRGDNSAGSDIDILVEFDRPVGIEFIDLAHFLEQHLKHRIDLVSRNGVKDKYFKEIQREIVYV